MKNQKSFDSFLQLSAEMTGYSTTDLLGTGVAHEYFNTFKDIVSESIRHELWDISNKIWKTHKDESKKEEAIRIELLSDVKYGPLVRNIIKLWYLGQWDELSSAWRERYGSSTKDVNFIVSPDSYKQGLVWNAIGAHPMGAKQPGFATWSRPPAAPDKES